MTIKPTHLLSIACALLIAIASGCGTKSNPNYCPGKNPDNNCNEPDVCDDNSQCTGEKSICELMSGVCVQCTPSSPAACTGIAPFCGMDNACRGCGSNAECGESGLCLSDGSCAATDSIAYVAAAPAGTDNAACSAQQPCTRIASALATGRANIKVSGTLAEAVLVNKGKHVSFFAAPGAKITNPSGAAIVTVQDDGTSLTIHDLMIADASNSISGFGVLVPAANGSPTITLDHVTLTNNAAGAVSIAGGSFTLTRSTVSNNIGGGVAISGGTFVVVGNAFFHNGTDSSTIGGIYIKTDQNPTNRLELNSFNRNQAQDGLGSAVQCVAGTFTARNNILSENATVTNMLQFSGPCAHAFSIVRPGPLPPGATNKAGDPLFTNTMGDLHIRPGTAAAGAADPATDLSGVAAVDIDGVHRTSPADLGAYALP